MNGKVNIVFGFIYLATTAVLGPVLLVPGKGEIARTFGATTEAVQRVSEGVEEGLPAPPAEAPGETTGRAVVSIMDYLKAEKSLGFVASAAHAHGNLEGLLNIVAGLVILALAIPASYKALLSLIFILGALFHSGMLYLAAVFGLSWAGNFTLIGAIAIVAGLLLTGVACIFGIKTEGPPIEGT
jgi:amino acid transporter